VPGAGHLPLEEQPDYCNRVLLDFLRSPEPPVTPPPQPASAAAEAPN